MFLIEFGFLLGLEAGLILTYYQGNFNFYKFQILLLPIFLVFIISKYNKCITTIEIDSKLKLKWLMNEEF